MKNNETFPILKIVAGVLLLGMISCKDDSDLKSREKILLKKEQYLNERDVRLTIRENELIRREKFLDSMRLYLDTFGVYNERITGTWNVQMKCIETDCPGSAIGDVKKEKWEIGYEVDKVIVRSYTSNNLSRVYMGIYKYNTLEARAVLDSANTTEIVFSIRPTEKEGSMEGTREIKQSDGCTIVYALSLQKQK